jgi:hypothetical protein
VHAQSDQPAPARAAAFRYVPGTRHYRLTTVVLRTQNQAGGRAPFQFTNTTTMDVTLAIQPHAHDTLALRLTVDSVAVKSDLDAPPPNLDGYRGVRLTGLISPQGQLYAFDAPPHAPEPTVNLYRSFRRFLVPFPRGDIGPNSSWTDTTTTAVKVGGFDTHTVSKITGDTVYAGQHAWRVERTSNLTIAGTASSDKGPVRLEGEGTVRGVDFVAVAGAFLANSSTQTTQLQEFKPQEPGVESMPIQQTIRSTVDPRLGGGPGAPPAGGDARRARRGTAAPGSSHRCGAFRQRRRAARRLASARPGPSWPDPDVAALCRWRR